MTGYVQCLDDAVLQVTKKFEIRFDNNKRMSVRCYSYRYVGLIPGDRWLVKYHNLHADPDQYIHRVYNPQDAERPFTECLHRYQFPTFPEVLNEFQTLVENYPNV